MIDVGFDISLDNKNMNFEYGKNVFGPEVERRRLDDIRSSLKDPTADGPEVLYAIAMDVGNLADKKDLVERNLLYGAVIYAAGSIGKEPVRSQGHIHAVSPSIGMSTPEVYEIWEGKAIIYMQETAEDDPGRCYAVVAQPGDVVLVPPSWAHCTINADVTTNMAFGAWCVRDYGFDYTGVRAHGGVAYYPIIQEDTSISFEPNKLYQAQDLIIKAPNSYEQFGIEKGVSIYKQYQKNKALFDFVKDPRITTDLWKNFEP